MARRVIPFDRKKKRHTLRFGEAEVALADADLAQLHDTLLRLHAFSDQTVERLCEQLRDVLVDGDGADSILDLDTAAAAKVQLAVYADQAAQKPVSPALAEARRQAFLYLESRPQAPPSAEV